MRNPPCCVSLQKATKIIAIAHTVMMSLALLVLTISLVVVSMNYTSTNIPSTISLPSNTINIFGLADYSSTKFKTDEQGIISKDNLTITQNGQVFYSETYVVSRAINQAMGVIITGIVICTTYLVLDIQLWKGANDRNLFLCKVWFQVQFVNSVISFVLMPVVIFVMLPQNQVGIFIGCLGQVALVFYVMWVVYAFMKELKLGEGGCKVEGQDEAFFQKH